MLDIALNSELKPVHLKDLAERQELSMKYLEQIVPSLKTAGLIRSIRGANGGYTLAKSPNDITLLNIVEALEGSLTPVECVGDPTLCSRAPECAVHDVWKEVQSGIRKTLGSQTLADLVKQQQSKGNGQAIVCGSKS